MKMSIKFSFESVLFKALVANIYPCIIENGSTEDKKVMALGISHALFNLTKAYFFCMSSILKARII